jgi:putative mRNA 3-end processing factor
MLIEPTESGLYCAAGGFHIDPWQPVARAVITHAHADHLRPGSGVYLCTREAEPIVRLRLPADAAISALPYGETVVLDGVRVSLHPAGHILGAAQVRVEHRGEVWVAAGDYKRQPDPTSAAFEALRCHAFITEATFGLPIFRWQPTGATMREICGWWDDTRAAGRPAVLFAYALGKSERILAELVGHTDRPVYVHGSLIEAIEIYRQAGVRMVEIRRAAEEARGRSFAGELIVAPLSARGTLWMRRFGDHSSAFASGWMRLRGARRRRAYDRGFPLSDHADWDDLLGTVRETGAERVYVTHGYTEPLARHLQEIGLDAHAWRTSYEGEVAAE